MGTVAKKEIGIPCRSHEVRGILAGKQTQLRRIMKPQPHERDGMKFWQRGDTVYALPNQNAYFGDSLLGIWGACPYGRVGDRLWVRETWNQYRVRRSDRQRFTVRKPAPGIGELTYAADCDHEPPRWRPSIHMPRWACRIVLEITDVRVERLDSITREDAIAEGIHPLPGQDADDPSAWWESAPGKHQGRDPLESFRKLWIDINGKWHPQLWVWALSFKRLP